MGHALRLASPPDASSHLCWAVPVAEAAGTYAPCPKGRSRFHGNNWNQKYHRAGSVRPEPSRVGEVESGRDMKNHM